jgi:hypothetical protein
VSRIATVTLLPTSLASPRLALALASPRLYPQPFPTYGLLHCIPSALVPVLWPCCACPSNAAVLILGHTPHSHNHARPPPLQPPPPSAHFQYTSRLPPSSKLSFPTFLPLHPCNLSPSTTSSTIAWVFLLLHCRYPIQIGLTVTSGFYTPPILLHLGWHDRRHSTAVGFALHAPNSQTFRRLKIDTYFPFSNPRFSTAALLALNRER